MPRTGVILAVLAFGFFFTMDLVVPAQAMDEEVFKSLVAITPQQNLADDFAIYVNQYDWMWPMREPNGRLTRYADVFRYVILENLSRSIHAKCKAKEGAAESPVTDAESPGEKSDIDVVDLETNEDLVSSAGDKNNDKPESQCFEFESFLPWLETHAQYEDIVASMKDKKRALEFIDILEQSRFTPENINILFRTWQVFPEFTPWAKLHPKVFALRMAFLETAFSIGDSIVQLKERECAMVKPLVPDELDGSYGWTDSVLSEIKEKCLVGNELTAALERCDATFLDANADIIRLFEWNRKCRDIYKIKQNRDYWGIDLTFN